MIEPRTVGSTDTLYELGRIALAFALIGIGIWIVIKAILRSAKRGPSHKQFGINRQERHAERARLKRRHR